jgi:hypothetical protein
MWNAVTYQYSEYGCNLSDNLHGILFVLYSFISSKQTFVERKSRLNFLFEDFIWILAKNSSYISFDNYYLFNDYYNWIVHLSSNIHR